MSQFQAPELLRTPLEELCLHVKLITKGTIGLAVGKQRSFSQRPLESKRRGRRRKKCEEEEDEEERMKERKMKKKKKKEERKEEDRKEEEGEE